MLLVNTCQWQNFKIQHYYFVLSTSLILRFVRVATYAWLQYGRTVICKVELCLLSGAC